MSQAYVIQWTSHLRDGCEYSEKIVPSLEAALDLIPKWSQPNDTVRLFKLGEEVPLTIADETTERVVTETRRVVRVKSSEETR